MFRKIFVPKSVALRIKFLKFKSNKKIVGNNFNHYPFQNSEPKIIENV